MLRVEKKYKTYGKRKLQVFDDDKFLGEITEAWHWICISNLDNHKILRKVAMENLWWLLHTDKLDDEVTPEEAWQEKINYWDRGRMYGVPVDKEPTSNFFSEEEKNIALNSINNI